MLNYRLVRQSVFDGHMGGRVYKYYARAIVSARSTLDMIAAKIAETNTLTPTDVKAVIDGVWREIRDRLRSGQIVELGELGHFRLTIQNHGGSLTEADWTPDLIHRAYIKFIPTKSMKSIADGVKMQRWHNPDIDNAKRAISAAAKACSVAREDLRMSETTLARFQSERSSMSEQESRIIFNKFEANVAHDKMLCAQAEEVLKQKQRMLRKLQEVALIAQGIDPAEAAIHLKSGQEVLEVSEEDLKGADNAEGLNEASELSGEGFAAEDLSMSEDTIQFLTPDEMVEDMDDDEAKHVFEKLQQRFAAEERKKTEEQEKKKEEGGEQDTPLK